MRRLVLKMSMSLDGYVGGPDGEVDWIMRTLDAEARRSASYDADVPAQREEFVQ